MQQEAGNRAVIGMLQRSQATALKAPDATPPAARAPRLQRGLWGSIKKGFKKIGSGIKKGAQWVGGGLKKVGKGIGDAFKAIGSKTREVAAKIWNGAKWVGKQLWTKIEGVFRRVAQWVEKLPTRLGRLFAHLWEGVRNLQPWSLAWWRSLGKASTWADFGKWVGRLAIYALEVTPIPEAAETLADFIKFNTRPLDEGERRKAVKVFGTAIPWDLVRVDKHAVLGPAFTGRAFVSFNTINGWATLDDHTLIHELTHVWQYNTKGAIYMPNAIHAQAWGAGYEYGNDVTGSDTPEEQQAKRAETLRAKRASGGTITSFNEEQQGQILGDYYVLRYVDGALEDSDEVKAYEPFVDDVRG